MINLILWTHAAPSRSAKRQSGHRSLVYWMIALISTSAVSGCSLQAQRQVRKASHHTSIGDCSNSDLPTAGIHGISGLSGTNNGEIYAIAERGTLLSFAPDLDGRWCLKAVESRFPESLTNLDIDFESIAVLSDDTIVFGSEGRREDSTSPELFHVSWDDNGLVELDRWPLDLQPWPNLKAVANRGVEGLCATGAWIFAGVEQVANEDGKRVAPIVALNRETGRGAAISVALHSESGRLSALECTLNERGTFTLWMMERDYEVAYVHTFELSSLALATASATTTIHPNPTAVHDLSACFGDETSVNFEALYFDQSELWLVNDNQHRRLQMPTHRFRYPECAATTSTSAYRPSPTVATENH